MEEVINQYNRYVYLSFALLIFIFVVFSVAFLVYFVNKRKKKVNKELELVNRIRNINSKICPYCNNQIDGDSVYCKYCGKNLTQEIKHD